MSTKSEGPTTHFRFIKQRGAPSCIHSDNLKMQTSAAWNDICNQYLIKTTTTKPYHPNQNPCEPRIQAIKSRCKAIMDSLDAPPSTWLYCAYYVVDLLNHNAHPKLVYIL